MRVTLFREPRLTKPRHVILTWVSTREGGVVLDLPVRHAILSMRFVPEQVGRDAHYRLEYEAEISGETYSEPKEQVTVEFVTRTAYGQIPEGFRHVASVPDEYPESTVTNHIYARLVPNRFR